jgi:metallo-beta-lactamase family protein
LDIQFIGAIRTVTGSMHLVTACGKNILLDCGLYQGRRKEAFERNRRIKELIDPEAIDAVVLSHAHIDHSGNVPTLVSGGYRGPIYTTPATRDLTEIMLLDSAHIQERDVEYVNKKRKRQGKAPFFPLYTPGDIPQVIGQMETTRLHTPTELFPGITLTFFDAGHLLGSALTVLDIDEGSGPKRLAFTGDLGRYGMPILRDPEPLENVDYLISESTYGDRYHPSVAEVKNALRTVVQEIMQKRSKLVIPAFSVGRTQEIVYQLHQLYDEESISGVPIFVDSPLSNRATEVFRKHPECFDREVSEFLMTGRGAFRFANLTYITDVEDSKALNAQPGPMVIVSASGMCEHGRILHHLKNNIEDPDSIVLIIGYQAENTLGRRLVRGDREVKIFGDEYRVRAKVEVINALSAHADRRELFGFAESLSKTLKRVFLVHGEYEQTQSLAELMNENHLHHVTIPQPGQRFTL